MRFQNLSPLDRTIRLAIGLLMLWIGWANQPLETEIWPIVLRVFAWLPLVTGALGWCPIYAMLGLSTRKPAPPRTSAGAQETLQPGLEFFYASSTMELRSSDAILGGLTLRSLKWTAVLAALAFLLLLEAVRQTLHPLVPSWQERLLLGSAAFTGALFFFGAVFHAMERMQGRLDDLHHQLSRMAVSEERLRIAQEMHDGQAQVLAYVNTKAQAIREHLKRERTEEAAKQLDELAAAAREIYDDVRESILGLRSAAAPEGSAADSLREYLARWEAESGIACRLHLETDLRLPTEVELQVQRIIQEALANVRKHSKAHGADVRIEPADGRLRITVEDDGVGFNPAELGLSQFPRFGLSIMRERASSLGGRFQLDSLPGAGTRVTLEVPVQRPIVRSPEEPLYEHPHRR